MKKVLIGIIIIVRTFTLPAALPAGAASSNLPPVHVPPPPNPTRQMGPVNIGGPMHSGPGKVHCDCLRLVNGHTESCCP